MIRYNLDKAYQVETAKSIKLNPAERTTHDLTRLVFGTSSNS